jgi:hypothetical protein
VCSSDLENQLERTDHTHLGQLLTYASGLEAVTIVWIAARFTEEHRSTLDWLNRITDESFRFFGLEIELWRIGVSPAAPKFNIVSEPNDWSQSVAQAARAIDDADLSETRLRQRAYWEAFQTVLNRQDGPVRGNKRPRPQPWIGYSVGRSHFKLAAVMLRPKRQVRAELYISGPRSKETLELLETQRSQIEAELGYSLEWEDMKARRDCRIATYLSDADPDDEVDWLRQHEWLAQRLNELHRVFARRLTILELPEAGSSPD